MQGYVYLKHKLSGGSILSATIHSLTLHMPWMLKCYAWCMLSLNRSSYYQLLAIGTFVRPTSSFLSLAVRLTVMQTTGSWVRTWERG